MTQSQPDWGDLNSGSSTTYQLLAELFPQTTFIFASLTHPFPSVCACQSLIPMICSLRVEAGMGIMGYLQVPLFFPELS